MSVTDPVELNILGVQQLVGSRMNKVDGGASVQVEGVESEYEDELTLKLDDAELIALANRWTTRYSPYETKIKIRQEANKTFYLGRQNLGLPSAILDGQPISANLLFEAEETFLPAALSKNPEPVVWSDDTQEGNKLSKDVKTMLQYHANNLVLRRKLTLMTRMWSLDFLSAIKHGWDAQVEDIESNVRDVKKFIFDPDGYVDPYGHFVGYLGERITLTADKLIDKFPNKSVYITSIVDGKLGTDVMYTEWWTDEYTFCSFKGEILDKSKNPHFNYSKTQKDTDLDGNETEEEVKGQNHFAIPKKPYTFLAMFSLGDQPHDITGLIEQNIPNQRRVTRRTEQIDYNLSRQNNSDVFSENNFTQETAKQAATAIAKGHPVLIPSGGPISEAIVRLNAQGLPASFFTELENSKNDVRSIFGTQGITPNSQGEAETARGEILNTQRDNSRIGGGIGDAIEQVANTIFNWWVQLYYVYYNEPHVASIMGQMKAVEYVQLQASDLTRQLIISVAPDSMKPKDEVTEMNQALSLFEAEALDIKTLLTILNFPDPQNTAAQVMLYKTNPQMYMQLNFPELAQQIQQMQQGQGAPGGAPQGGQPQGGAQGPQPQQSTGGIPANPSLSQVPINTPATP